MQYRYRTNVKGARIRLLDDNREARWPLARVLRAEYPEGYQPKRETELMQPMPYLAGDLPALAAYLADP